MKEYNVRVLVIEDEPIILKHITRKLEELEYGIQVIATAYNGQEGLRKIYELHPDAVFSDIRMPVMDGIDLLKNIRVSFPELPVIMISGYSDYEYMRQCIDYSVTDYLLKPINNRELRDVAKKIKELVWQKRQSVTKEILASAMLKGELEKSLPYNIERNRFQLLLINVGNMSNSYSSSMILNTYSKIWEAVPWNNLISKIISDDEECWIIDERTINQKIVLLSSENVRQSAYVLQKLLTPYMNERALTIIYDNEKYEYSAIHRVADKLRMEMKNRIIPFKDQIICFNELKKNIPSTILKNEFVSIFLGKNISLMESEFLQIGEQWKRDGITQKDIISILKNYVIKLRQRSLVYQNIDLEHVMNQIEELFVLETDYRSVYQKTWALLCELYQDNINPGMDTEEMVSCIRQFIDENYSHEINLAKLSDEFHFSSAYLSKIFKKYIGETPVKYLNDLRIKKSQRLLRLRQDMPVLDVAKNVGYENSQYFCRIFKNYTGMTPSEYREIEKDNTHIC